MNTTLPSRRQRLHSATLDEIKTTAWQQIVEHGAPALSLREITRRMGMTAPALYRYYADRDALVTALTIDAFTSFAVSLEAARDALPSNDHAGRFRAIASAYRGWAVGNPQKYSLVFGTPIPGYHIPPEVEPAGQRCFLVLVGVLGEAYHARKLSIRSHDETLPEGLGQHLSFICQMGNLPYPAMILNLALSAWAKIHGIVSLELHGIVDGMLGGNKAAFFQHEIDDCMRRMGLI